jgi:hypothetical protein
MVDAQAVADRAPDLLPMFDALVDASRALAGAVWKARDPGAREAREGSFA